MKKKILKLLSGGMLMLLLALPCSMTAFADTVAGSDAGGAVQANSATTTKEVTEEGMTFRVTYPTDITCGTPVSFQFETVEEATSVPVADMQYRIHSLLVNDGTGKVSVYDVSFGQNSAYNTKDSWEFTFYASGTYYIRFNALYKTSDSKVKTMDTKEIVLTIQDPSYPSVEAIVERVAGECVARCTTDFDKAVWLNDWLVDKCTYDNSYSFCSAEGALARGTGTCEAYHRAYVMLLNKVGIATGRITGNGHVWTAVKLDGKWYQVDTTWNDAGYEDPRVDLKHLYFGLNDAITSIVHSEHKPVAGYESNSLENNYFIKTGTIAKWADPQKEAVQRHIDAGETHFTLEIKNTTYADVLYSLVAHVLTNTSWSTGGKTVSLEAEYIRTDERNGVISCSIQSGTDTEGSGSENNGGSGSSGGSGNGGGSSSGSGNGGGSSSGSGSSGGSGNSGGTGIWYGNGTKNGKSGVTVYKGVEYAQIYNFEYYVNTYADIKKAFGNDEKAVLNHFITYGMKEGRLAQENFNVHFYRSMYQDLENAFGDDLKSYYYHYLNYGIKEKRKTTP